MNELIDGIGSESEREAVRLSDQARTLFASVGLSGTEVILANALIDKVREEIESFSS